MIAERGIHSTVPETDERVKAEEVAERLIEMAAHLKGEHKTATTGELADRLGIRRTGTNQKVREAMKINLVEKHIPFVSTTKGFYLAADKTDLLKYRESLLSRMKALGRDIHAIDIILAKADIHEELGLKEPVLEQSELF